MIFGGYGATSYMLSRSHRRSARALSFGFAILAAVGAAMFLGRVFFPHTTWSIIASAAEHHVIFISVATLAWPIGLMRYLYRTSRP